MNINQILFRPKLLRQAVKASIPLIAMMGGNAVASSRNTNSSINGRRNTAVYVSDIKDDSDNRNNLNKIKKEYKKSPFAVFSGSKNKPIKKAEVSVDDKALAFLKKNGLLSGGDSKSASLSGNTLNSLGRKIFAHNTVDWAVPATSLNCTNGNNRIFGYLGNASSLDNIVDCAVVDTVSGTISSKTNVSKAACNVMHAAHCSHPAPDTPPAADTVAFLGTLQEGQTLNGTYNYNDDESDVESGTTFKWYRSDDAGGTSKAAIGGATNQNYTLTASEVGKFINFEVTPKNANATGSAVESSINASVVTAANSDPEFDDADDVISFSIDEDSGANNITDGLEGIEVTDADAGDTLTWAEGSTAPTKGTTSISGTTAATAGNDLPSTSYTFTPTANANGADSFTVDVSDGNGGTDTLTVNVTINDIADISSDAVVTSDGTYKAGDNLDFGLTFDESVTVSGGPPRLELTIGGTTKYATYQSGSPGTALNFGYTIEAGLNDADGITVSNTLDLNTGTIVDTDTDGTGADLGNISFAGTGAVLVDTTVPTVSITDNTPGTAIGDVTYTFTFSEGVNGFTVADVVVTGGTKAASFATGVNGDSVYTLVITPNANSSTNITVDVAANVATDAVSNNNTIAAQSVQAVDTAAPGVVITDNTPGTAIGDVTYTFTFSEGVTGFTVADVVATGGTKAASFATGVNGDSVYTLVITPNANSSTNITVDVAANVATDAVSNNNTIAAQSVQTVDTAAPGVVITDNTPGTAIGDVTYTFTFSEVVTGFTVADVVVTGGTKAASFATGVNGDSVYTLVITPNANSSTNITVDVAASVAIDAVSNNNTIAAQSVQAVDTAVPGVVITDNTPGTAIGDVTYTFTFSEGVTGFTVADVVVTGGAKAASFATGVNGDSVYTLVITPNANSSTNITVDVAANVATDAASNNNTIAAQSVQAVDTAAPGVVITDNTPGTAIGDVTYTFTFSEAVTGFAVTDVVVTGGTKAGGFATGVDGDSVYTLVITPNANSSSNITVDVAANVAIDAASNNNTIAAQSVQAVDTAVPAAPSTPDLTPGTDTGSSNSDDITGNTTPTFAGTAEANSTVELFYAGSTSLGTDTATGGVWSINASTIPMGTQSITAKSTDAAGNVSNASTALSLELDTTGPNVSSVSSSSGNGTYSTGDTVPITVTFDSIVDVTDFPQISLETGDSDAVVNYSSGTGSTTLSFDYSVATGHKTPDLIYLATTSLALNGGNIADRAGNIATLTLATPGAAGSLSHAKNIDIDASLVINEFDYDQGATDALEFLEIKNLTASPIDLTAYSVQVVNSAGTGTTSTIALTGTLAANTYHVICTDNSKVLHCDQDITPNTDWINDGAPNAVILNKGATSIDVVSYEGDTPNGFTETSGATTDDGTVPLVGLSRFADGTDTNDNSSDFSLKCVTPGSENNLNANTACFDLSINDPVAVNEGDSGTTAVDFTVSLSNAATSDVVVNYSVADNTATSADSDYVAATSTATISAGSTSQTISVDVNGDKFDESSESFFVNLTGTTSNAVITDNQGTGTITDNDTTGITVNPTSGLITNENANQDGFTVVLDSKPRADVVIPISSSDATEGSVSPTSLTFIPSNWNVPQTVTTTGLADVMVDGDIGYSIITGAATSSDSNYNTMNPSDVSVTNVDTDVPGFTVSPTSGLVIAEQGYAPATFTVKLNTQPTANVSIGLSSDDTSEGTVSPSSLTFGTGDWNTNQTVTITNVDDFIVDGSQAFSILTAVATSSDGNYNGIDPSNVSITTTDNDSRGLALTSSSLILKEPSEAGTFTLALKTLPTANVTIPLSVVDTTECAISTSTLSFNTANWNIAQTITVTALDDAIQDGNQNCNVVTGNISGGDYNGLNFNDVAVTILDDEATQVGRFKVKNADVIEADAGGTSNMVFTVTMKPPLTTEATVDYTTVGGTATADVDFTSKNGTLTFAPGDTQKTVSISVIGDNTPGEGKERFELKLSNAIGAVINDPKGKGTIIDNDGTPAFSIDDVSIIEGDTGTSEAEFTVYLSPAAGAQTSVDYLTVDDNATGGSDYGIIAPATLTFAAGETSKTVKVTIIADTQQEEDEVFFVDLQNAIGTVGIADARGEGTIVEDDVNDGVSTEVENEAPNSGDGNDDGTPDGKQLNTASSPSAEDPEEYITAAVSNGATGKVCNAILEVNPLKESQMSAPDSDINNFPAGLLSFVLNCEEAAVKLYYHGISSTANLTVRKFANNAWITVPGAVLGTETINGNEVVTASFFLKDNDPGDACPQANVICDPVGVALQNVSSGGGIISLRPEITVLGNGLDILDGDDLARVTDHTQFADTAIGEASIRTFIIKNEGSSDLIIVNTQITGANSDAFQILSSLPSRIGYAAVSNTSQLQVAFTPKTSGTYDAEISIESDDSDESPYTFAIKGLGIEATSGSTSSETDSDGDGIPDLIEAILGTDPLVKDNDVLGNNRFFVMQLYRNFLFREGDDSGITDWQIVLDGQIANRSQVVNGFCESEEVNYKIIPVIRLYFSYFKRLPDLDGLKYWVALMQQGQKLDKVSDAFSGSTEFQTTYGQLDDNAFINLVYQNILGRDADTSGLNHWLTQLSNGSVTRGQLMTEFSESVEYKNMTENSGDIIMLYVGLFNRMPSDADVAHWTLQLENGENLIDIIEFFLATGEYSQRFYE